MAKYTYYSDFQPNKIYQYKTYSLDGAKVLHQVNMKYIFAFSEGHLSNIEKFYFSSSFIDYNKRNKLSFPQEQMKDINDKSCRYILCEKEIVYYNIDGVELFRKTSYHQFDKTLDTFNYQKGKKVSMNKLEPRARTFYFSSRKDNNNVEVNVLVPGAIHYNMKPGIIDRKERRITMLGLDPFEVECKMVDSLEII